MPHPHEPLRGAVLTLCSDCQRPATVSLGTTWLCEWCKWETQADILRRRPDLLLPGQGIGRPTGSGHDPKGPPLLACDRCDARWHDRPLTACPWCIDRLRWDQEIQQSIEQGRFREYLQRIEDGDTEAVEPAIHLARRLGTQPQLARVLARTGLAA